MTLAKLVELAGSAVRRVATAHQGSQLDQKSSQFLLLGVAQLAETEFWRL